MTELTITQAAEQLATRIIEESAPSNIATDKSVKRGGDKELSLDEAGDMLADRISGKPARARKKAAKTQDAESSEEITSHDVARLRRKRESAAATARQLDEELNGLCERALKHYEGIDPHTRVTSPEFLAMQGYIARLTERRDLARAEEVGAWTAQCRAENEAFSIERPDWDDEDRQRVLDWLVSLGATSDELQVLWSTPWPVALDGPVAIGVARAAGFATVADALRSVNIDPDQPVLLRDHRVQILIAKAEDAQRQNQAAA